MPGDWNVLFNYKALLLMLIFPLLISDSLWQPNSSWQWMPHYPYGIPLSTLPTAAPAPGLPSCSWPAGPGKRIEHVCRSQAACWKPTGALQNMDAASHCPLLLDTHLIGLECDEALGVLKGPQGTSLFKGWLGQILGQSPLVYSWRRIPSLFPTPKGGPQEMWTYLESK
jgi:hypothetical protein